MGRLETQSARRQFQIHIFLKNTLLGNLNILNLSAVFEQLGPLHPAIKISVKINLLLKNSIIEHNTFTKA